jgi:hypothetical protein
MDAAGSRGFSRRGLLRAGGTGLLAIGVGQVLGCTADAPGLLPGPSPRGVPGSVPGVVPGGSSADVLPATRRFDLAQPARLVLGGVRLHEAQRSMQGIGYDVANRRLFIVQTRDHSPGADLCINRVTSSGVVTGHVHVDNAGHGQSFGVEAVGEASYLWLECDANENSPAGRGTALARFEFAAGKPARVQKFFTDSLEVSCSVDPVNRRLLVRRPEDGRTMYGLFDLAQAVDGFTQPLVRFEEPAELRQEQVRSALQGFAVWGRYAYLYLGTRGHAGTIEDPFDSALAAIDMTTGEVVQRELTSVGSSLVGREPEGLAINVSKGRPQLCLGLASRRSRAHLANIYAQDALA